jgi:hypothetical protein
MCILGRNSLHSLTYSSYTLHMYVHSFHAHMYKNNFQMRMYQTYYIHSYS